MVDAGEDSAGAAAAVEAFNALTPEELATSLDLPGGSVKSVADAEVVLDFIPEESDAPPINDAAPLAETEGSNQTVKEDEVSAGAIVGILLLALFILLPLAFIAYARNKFGPGKELAYLRYSLSHSNARIPFLYMPNDMREEQLSQLYAKTANSQQELDNRAVPNQADPNAPPGETEEEKKMRLYFEGETI